MHNPVRTEHEDHSQRENGSSKNSTSMTIEYLRARLHAERLVSKAARERAEELSDRVSELEGQLQIVTFQRKKAENATRDVLSFLEGHGISSDISETYDTEQEGSIDETNAGKSNSLIKDEGSSAYSEAKGGHKVESSDSEHESTPSSSGTLSWKRRREAPRACEKKYYYDSTVRRRANVIQFGSPKHRPGKSCRQIKPREIRSVVELSGKHTADANNSAHSASCSDNETLELKNCSANQYEGALSDGQISGFQDKKHAGNGGRSLQKGHQSCNQEMKIALEHQARIIGRYQAEERVQREWEDKCRDNSSCTPDSFEPGNHSDVTEERDETEAVASHPAEIISCSTHNEKAKNEGSYFSKEYHSSYLNSFKLGTPEEIQPPSDLKLKEHATGSSAPDFAFPVVDDKKTQESHENYIVQSPSHSSPRFYPLHDSPCIHHVSNSHVSSSSCKPESVGPHSDEGSHRPEAVLEALNNAKVMLKQQVGALPSIDSGMVARAILPSSYSRKSMDPLKIPLGCSELFRVPADFHSEASSPCQTRLMVADSSSYPTTLYPYSQGLLTGSDPSMSSPGEPKPSASATDQFGHSPAFAAQSRVMIRKPLFDFDVNAAVVPLNGYTQPSPSTYPNVISQMSSPSYLDLMPQVSSAGYSDLMPQVSSPIHPQLMPQVSSNGIFPSQFPGRVVGVPPAPSHSLFYGDDARRYM